jgi:OOP family OmpA-OmpF porin
MVNSRKPSTRLTERQISPMLRAVEHPVLMPIHAACRLLSPRWLPLCAASLFLAGCSHLHELKQMNPEARDFSSSLAAEYLAYAESEAEELRWAQAEHFAEKGLQASKGDEVYPEMPNSLTIPADDKEDLVESRYRLLASLTCGTRDIVPQQAARAQMLYDCWVEKSGSPRDPSHEGLCKAGFSDTMSQVEAAVEPIKASEAERAGQSPGRYHFYFSSNSTVLGTQERAHVKTIAADLHDKQYFKISVIGYADKEGSRQYNKVLSLRRAKAIKQALVKAGLPHEKIIVSAAGESYAAHKLQDKHSRRVDVKVEAYQ